jgi:hypothetical protein
VFPESLVDSGSQWVYFKYRDLYDNFAPTRLAQLVERTTFNRVATGSIPVPGVGGNGLTNDFPKGFSRRRHGSDVISSRSSAG